MALYNSNGKQNFRDYANEPAFDLSGWSVSVRVSPNREPPPVYSGDEPEAWKRVYLLGWYDHDGKSYLTSWDGDYPMIHVVVSGTDGKQPPLWSCPVPVDVTLEVIPQGLSRDEMIAYATQRDGIYAFGWAVPRDIKREWPMTIWGRTPPSDAPELSARLAADSNNPHLKFRFRLGGGD